MADFSYNGKTITVNGPLKISSINTPLNAKYRVEYFNDIDDIPTPAVGELIYVLKDETRNYDPSIYVITKLKANSFGVNNTNIDTVELLDTFLTEVDAKTVNGKKFWYGTKAEYDELVKISGDTIYIISDMESQIGPTGPTGKQGLDGLSAYDIWVSTPGNENKTQVEFIESMKGVQGKSAYELWLESNGFTSDEKTEADFLNAITGKTTSISLSGTEYKQVNGKIDLPVNNSDSLLLLDNDGKISSSFLSDDISAGDAKTINGKTIWCGTEEEYNILTSNGEKEDSETIYIIEDGTISRGPTGPTGPQGPQGITGPTGPRGESLKILGIYSNISELPSSNNIGDCYLIGNSLYIWNGEQFINSGDINFAVGKYTKLESPNGQYYRISVNNDGNISVINDDAFVLNVQANTSLYKGLIINQMYGGGAIDQNKAPVSHSFIELYNTTDEIINLKGLSLQVSEGGTNWQVISLCGFVKPKTSFLIRFARVTDKNKANTRLSIDKFDQEVEMPLSEYGFKAYLRSGLDKCPYANPFNIDGSGTIDSNFVDCLSYGSENLDIDAYSENGYLKVANYYTGIRRIDFNYYNNSSDKKINTNNDYEKTVTWLTIMQEAVNWKTINIDIYRPRCQADDRFDNQFDKLELKNDRPMNINISFGEDGNTTRLFNWHTILGSKSRLKYKKQEDSKWKIVIPTETVVELSDTSAIVNKARIDNLEAGIYEYKVGEEGRWSDVYIFEVKHPTKEDEIKFTVFADQQAWNNYEYSVWEKCANFIYNNESQDFLLNVGDISQNGDIAFEWRGYYELAKDLIQNHVHMSCCGNNDLSLLDGSKIDPTSYKYYSNNENMDIPSMYSFNYGYIHFVSLNSNTNFTNPYLPFKEQINWLIDDLAKAENKKQYIIVYMHEAPYTIVRKNAIFDEYHKIFAAYNVDLVLCGHHHMYSRSNGIGQFIGRKGSLNDSGKLMNSDGTNGTRGTDNILSELQPYMVDGKITSEESRTVIDGVTYVMTQACGYKLKGKTTPVETAPWRSEYFRHYEPMYLTVKVNSEQIVVEAYEIKNIVPLSEINSNIDIPYKEMVDQVIIKSKG